MKIRNLAAANKLLAAYVPQVKELLGKDITLERTKPFMAALGNPQDKLRIIHVAGTSGKTSTAYYIASLLQTAGYKVGLTVSPHIDSITERVQINLEPLAEADFCEALGEFMDIVAVQQLQPTYFELLIGFVYWYFDRAQVDYAVIETGLGGLHDATNVAARADKICVITDIGYDHMHVLGNRLPDIAEQKAGIIKPGNHAFMFRQQASVTTVFETWARRVGASLHLTTETAQRGALLLPGLNKLPSYQQRNWLLAHLVYAFLHQRDNFPDLSRQQLTASMQVQVPGRMDVVTVQGKTLIMDGAHNGQKMAAFVKSFQKLYPRQKAAVLLNLKQGKEFQAVLPLLLPICSRLIVTTSKVSQDILTRPISPQVLAAAARELGAADVRIEPDAQQAYKELLKSPSDLLIITGSFYLLSGLRPFILKAA